MCDLPGHWLVVDNSSFLEPEYQERDHGQYSHQWDRAKEADRPQQFRDHDDERDPDDDLGQPRRCSEPGRQESLADAEGSDTSAGHDQTHQMTPST